MSHYFRKLFRSFGGNINVKVDLSNYATKNWFKKCDTRWYFKFCTKTKLASLKTEVDKLDIDKLVPVPVDLSKLSDIVKHDVKKIVFDQLVAKVNNIDKTELEKKISEVTDFVKEAKLTELENKIPDISNLATKVALNTVENKIPSVSSLVKKTDYNTKITEMENKLNRNYNKYITTAEFNKLAEDLFDVRVAQANLITKMDFDAKLSRINRKIMENKTKFTCWKWIDKAKNISFRLQNDKSHFEEDGTQNYLAFQPLNKYFKVIPILIMFHHGNLKDYLLKVLNYLQHLIIVLLQH